MKIEFVFTSAFNSVICCDNSEDEAVGPVDWVDNTGKINRIAPSSKLKVMLMIVNESNSFLEIM